MNTSQSLPGGPRPTESFLSAQTRHRAAARLWSLAAELIVAIVGLVISVLLAPIGYALIGLGFDLVNLATPMPDLVGAVGDRLTYILDHERLPPDGTTLLMATLVPLPGLAMLALGAARIRALMPRDHAALLASTLGARTPNLADLEETQLRNLVHEMAIAAGRAPPALMLLDQASCNLGWIGSADRATLIATRGMLDRLDRDQTQALVALAIASIGNGDGAMAARLVRTVQIIGLLMVLSQASVNNQARMAIKPLFGIGRRDGDDARRLELLQRVLADPWNMPQDSTHRPGGRLTMTDWAMMPTMGSMMIGIVVVPIVSFALFVPLVGLMWRRRRLLGDATAVQLTRYPQALGEALLAVDALPTALGDKAVWLVNLFMFEAGPSPFTLPRPYPTLQTRLARLNAMGAQVTVPPVSRQSHSAWALAALAPLCALLGALLVGLLGALVVMGCGISIMLNMLFLALPVASIHALLRWIPT